MVFDFLRRGAAETVEQKASATGPVVAYQTSGRVAWSPRDSVSLTRSGFCGNPVGFRSLKLIAEAAAALPGVAGIETLSDTDGVRRLKIALAPGAGGQETLKAAFLNGLDVRGFALKEPRCTTPSSA